MPPARYMTAAPEPSSPQAGGATQVPWKHSKPEDSMSEAPGIARARRHAAAAARRGLSSPRRHQPAGALRIGVPGRAAAPRCQQLRGAAGGLAETQGGAAPAGAHVCLPFRVGSELPWGGQHDRHGGTESRCEGAQLQLLQAVPCSWRAGIATCPHSQHRACPQCATAYTQEDLCATERQHMTRDELSKAAHDSRQVRMRQAHVQPP